MRNLQFILIATLVVFSLFFLFLIRKPVCIDSRVVERIDRVGEGSTERIWACRFDQTVPYSPWFREALPRLQSEIRETEQALQRIEPFRKPLRVVVLTHRPWVYRVHAGTLFIGEKVLASDGHLRRGLIKAWIREKDDSFGEGDLREEVYADFMQGVLQGEFELEDRLMGLRTRLGAMWPQVLKESPAYCRSPWKLSEHYEFCETNVELFEDQAYLWSLRPLLSSAILTAWKELSVLDQYRLLQDFSRFLRPRLNDDFEAETGGLTETISTLRSFQEDFTSRAKMVGRTWNRFDSLVTTELARRGRPVDGLFKLDILVQTDQELRGDEPWLQDLKEEAARSERAKLGVLAKDRLWLLPSNTPVKAPAPEEILAHRRVIMSCQSLALAQLLQLEGVSEKILLVESCDPTSLRLSAWLNGDTESFAKKTQKAKFMQIHLPSLARVKNHLDPALPVLDLRMKDRLAEVLNWSEVKWFEDIQSSQPKAALDAVEWFRVESL